MNFYDILQINHNATKSEIKKAYRELSILYHPDKSSEPNAKEKFQEIKTAYEVLYDDNKKNHYDLMSNEQRLHVFDIIKQYFTDIRPEYSYIYTLILDYLYSNQENELENDVNTLNIQSIYNRIVEKINSSIKKNIVIIDSLDYYDLHITFEEKYKYNTKKIKVLGNDIDEYSIPLHQNKYIIHDPYKGDITINVICHNNTPFQEFDEYDLLYTKKISLSQYIYGGQIKISLPDGKSVKLDFQSCLEKKPIFLIEKKDYQYLIHKL